MKNSPRSLFKQNDISRASGLKSRPIGSQLTKLLWGIGSVGVIQITRLYPAAHNLAKSDGVRLIGREELVEMILKMNPGSVPNPKQVIQ